MKSTFKSHSRSKALRASRGLGAANSGKPASGETRSATGGPEETMWSGRPAGFDRLAPLRHTREVAAHILHSGDALGEKSGELIFPSQMHVHVPHAGDQKFSAPADGRRPGGNPSADRNDPAALDQHVAMRPRGAV